MKFRLLGASGPRVSAIGLGCMAMSGTYGPADDAESVATVREALERGVTLLDTGDFYGMGHNEQLLREALQGHRRDHAFLSVKFGVQWGPNREMLGIDNRPASIKNFLGYTLRRLGTDHVDLYMPARVDPAVPIEDTVGAIAELIQAGYVRHLGLSEAGPDTVRRAHAVHPVAALQIEYSLMSRRPETALLLLRELGIALVAYGVLSRGLIGGHLAGEPTEARDGRRHYPRFQGENLARNLALVGALREVAEEKSVSVAKLAVAWVLSRGTDIVPLVGVRRREQLADLLGAVDLTLTANDLALIERAVPPGAVAGERYGEAGMAALDSERE